MNTQRYNHSMRHSPSIGEHLNDWAILFQASVTWVFWETKKNALLWQAKCSFALLTQRTWTAEMQSKYSCWFWHVWTKIVIFYFYMLVAEQKDGKNRLLEDVQWILKEITVTDMKTGKGVTHTWLPGLTRRRAASAHRWAALTTSAFRPVMGFSCRNKTQWDEDLQVCLCERTQNLD